MARALASRLSRRQAFWRMGAAVAGGMAAGSVFADPAAAANSGKCAKGTTACTVCVSLSNDPNNCGACGHVCSFPNATAACVSGTCHIASCNPGFGNCSGTGCTTNLLTDPSNCGACGTVCITTNATAVSCTSGVCSYTCASGFANCSGSGCTTNLQTDPNNCGACENVCGPIINGSASCISGICKETCNAGFADCSAAGNSGCITNLQTDPNNCGACGNFCPSGTCTNGACA